MSRSCRSDYSTSEWDPISAGQEDNFRAQDRQRAAVCCVAVSQEVDSAKGIFAKYNDLNFGKVILAPGLTKHRPRILVATAYDFCNNGSVHTTYVAFKGSSPLETLFDVADSQLQCQGQDGSSVSMKGHIHNGFYKALKEELPGPMELLGFCASMVPDSQIDRLIFCGHGLGGALSHLSMLSLLFALYGNNTEEPRKSESTLRLLSVAFGAPLFLDEEARDYFSATGAVPVEDRFLTYVNDEDPVPLMLNKLVAYPAQPTLHRKLNLKFQTILEVAGKVPALFDTTDKALVGGALGSTSRRIPYKLPPNLKQLEETDSDMTKLKSIQWQRGRGYAAFGQYTRLSGGYQTPVAPSEFDNWTLRWTPDSVKYHAMGHYARHVLTIHRSQVPLPIFAEGSPPKVDEAFLTIISGQPQGDGARLELVGYNLGLCLRKKCAVSDFEEKWEITRVEQNSIVLKNKVKLTAAEINVLANQTKVKVETMFGVTDWIQVRRKASGSGSHVINGLKHVIGKLVIFDSVQDTGPGSPSSQTLQKLRKNLETVATLSNSQSFLKKFFLGLQHPTRPVFDKRKDADGFIESVSNHLQQSSIKLKLEPFIGAGEKRQLFVRRGFGGFGFGMFSVGVGITMYVALAVIVSASTMGIAIPFAAGGLVIGAAALVLSHRRTIKLEEYDQIVKYIYSTLNPGQALLPGDKNVADYERAIIEKVKLINSQHPTALITQIQSDLKDQIRETRETVFNVITLMLEVDKAVGVAKEQKVLAVVGPENVGKSTLINILRKGPPREDLDEEEEGEEENKEADQAKTGFTTHTDDPKGYLAAAVGNLVAVDFPGMGAAHDRRSLSTMWEAFERLPDLCLVLMKFNGDVTADCADVPKQVRKKLCDKVVLMVNHVDGIMKGKNTAKIWKQYPPAKMEELRQAYIRNSDNMLDSVMLTSLSADLYDGEKALLKERGIIFAEETLDQIRGLVYKCDKSTSW